MAITPEQAGKVTREEIEAVNKAEQELDALLQKSFKGKTSRRITDPISKLSGRCRDELLRRYAAVGWSIEKKHESADQRDPRDRSYDYWVFKQAPRMINTGFAEQINNPAPPPWQER